MGAYADEPHYGRFPDLLAKCEKYFNDTLDPILKNYPKGEKFCLTQDTKRAAANLLHAVVMANNLSSRRKTIEWLEKADAEKNMLLVWLKSANSRRYITNRMLAYQQSQVFEIGKLIGGAQRYINESAQKVPAR